MVAVAKENPGPYAFPTVTITAGNDACQLIGPADSPDTLDLTNDGSLVAFNARDSAHETDLWLGDIQQGSPSIVYTAAESPGRKTDIWSPQLANGRLYWIERIHTGSSAHTGIDSWTVRMMDIGSRQVTSISHGNVATDRWVYQIRWNGQVLAASVQMADGSWRVESWNQDGSLIASTPANGTVYDLAIVRDGIVFTSGTPNPDHDSIGKMHTYYWQPSTHALTLIGTGAFGVAGCDGLAAWISDPDASSQSSGRPIAPRVFFATPPFTRATALSPQVSPTGTIGIDAVLCGSATLVWLEQESGTRNGSDAITLWQQGWASPVQLHTRGLVGGPSVNGGWVTWFEFDDNLSTTWVRGMRLQAVPGWHE